MEHCRQLSRHKTVTLLFLITACGTLLLPRMATLRLNKVQTASRGGLYRHQQHLERVANESTLNIPFLVPIASANTPRWESLLNSTLEETIKQDPPVLPKLRAPLSGRGYVVALGFWEQLMGASKNLFHLQCWANTLGSGVSVVQPFLLTDRTGLGLSFASDSTAVSKLGLDTLYNTTTWTQQWTEADLLAPLVSREDLISEISQFEKSVILVEVKYLSHSQHTKCNFTWDAKDVVKDLKQYQNLRVARNVCINLQREISPNTFSSLVCGDLAPHNSLVIFKEWRGLGPRRIYIHLPSCHKPANYHHFQLNNQVQRDAESYVDTHLGGVGQFISISARFEKMSRKYASMTVAQRQREIAVLIPQALSEVRELQRIHNVKKVHLAYDYGQFGSGSFKLHNYYSSEDMLIKFQNDVYNGTVLFTEYEESYRALSSTNPAHVALVQMAVSSMGKCLVQIGWGHIADLTKELFMRTHQNPYCIKCVPAGVCHQ